MAKKEEVQEAGKSAVGTPTKIGSGKPPIGGTGQSNKNFESGPEKSAPGMKESEISGSDIADATVTKADIETVEDLEILYPQLVAEIRDEVVAQIGKCPVQEVKKNLPGLYQRIVADIQSKSSPNLNVPGFLLELDDPFAEAALRTWQRLKGIDGLRLPYVLPFRDKKTKDALENYILRANGGGDTKRAAAAREALKKI